MDPADAKDYRRLHRELDERHMQLEHHMQLQQELKAVEWGKSLGGFKQFLTAILLRRMIPTDYIICSGWLKPPASCEVGIDFLGGIIN